MHYGSRWSHTRNLHSVSKDNNILIVKIPASRVRIKLQLNVKKASRSWIVDCQSHLQWKQMFTRWKGSFHQRSHLWLNVSDIWEEVSGAPRWSEKCFVWSRSLKSNGRLLLTDNLLLLVRISTDGLDPCLHSHVTPQGFHKPIKCFILLHGWTFYINTVAI